MSTNTIEDGIRAYLDSLGRSDRPEVDREAVRSLKAQIKAETDQLNKLKLLVALQDEEKGRVVDRAGIRAVFIAEAKGWADAEGVTPEAFQALGVPDDDLREAGFEVSNPSSHRSRSRRSSGGTSGSRAPRIPIDGVANVARELGESWKLTDLAEKLDRDVATVRNYVNKLVEEGKVHVIGDDPTHDGRGRAPKLYRSK